jgi:mannose-6-phosphate isomerase-like protein (cupin superfamily)
MKRSAEARECSTTAALYALGALPAEEMAQFEQRLASGCPLCTAAVEDYTEVANQLALGVAFAEPAPAVRARLLERIAASRGAAALGDSAKAGMKLIRSGDSPWIAFPAPGVEVRPLLGRKTLLVRMQPGAVFPEHEHRQVEQCYVLEGSVTDSDGVTVNAGDFICMPAGITHRPIHTATGCVFLIAYTS